MIKDNLYHYRAKVGKVIDGDTFHVEEIDLGFDVWIKRKKVRMLGINTMELHDKDPVKKQLAFEAKTYLTSRLEGKDIVIQVTGFDAFGRILALVFLEEDNVNNELLTNGLAVVFKD